MSPAQQQPCPNLMVSIVLLYHVSDEDGLHLGGRKVSEDVRGEEGSDLGRNGI